MDDEIPEGLRELRSEIGTARFVQKGGELRLSFTFEYVMAITDERGIAEVRWIYSLVDPRDESVLGQVHQAMREPQPDKTRILVQGERSRELPVDAVRLRPGDTYVLWVTVLYPEADGEQGIVGELLWPIEARF